MFDQAHSLLTESLTAIMATRGEDDRYAHEVLARLAELHERSGNVAMAGEYRTRLRTSESAGHNAP